MRNWHGNLSPFGKWHTVSSLAGALAAYAAAGITPQLVADFKTGTYGKAGALSTFDGVLEHSRASAATYVDSTGTLQTAASGVARENHHVWNGSAWVKEGYLHEPEAATNLLLNSDTLSTQSVTVTAEPHTLHFTGTGTVTLSGAATGSLVGTGVGEQSRVNLTFTPTAGSLTLTVTGSVTFSQLEIGSVPTSYIPTSGSTVTRAADILTLPIENIPYPEPVIIGEELFSDFATEGEWVDNGDGSWTVTNATTDTDLRRDGLTTIGKHYQYSFDITTTANLVVYTGQPTPKSLSTGSYTFNNVSTSGFFIFRARAGATATVSNISVREINPLAVSFGYKSLVTYADTNVAVEVSFLQWRANSFNFIEQELNTGGVKSGNVYFTQTVLGVSDGVGFGGANNYSPGINVPMSIASRHGSTFINGAVDGTALTANTTPTAFPDLSTTDLVIAPSGGPQVIQEFIMWADDLTDVGIAETSAFTFTDEFAMTITTTTANETFTIPCQNVGVFDAGIQWGDGSVSTITAYNDAGLTHTFANAGDHTIRIRGTFPNIHFNNAGDKLKVKRVDNLGDVGWTRLNRAFFGCLNMESFTAGTTDTSSVTNMSVMFYLCSSLTSLDVTNFDTSSVTDMSLMFYSCSSLTSLDVTNFDTSSVTSMERMFYLCSSLTSLDVTNFDTSSVTSMSQMFRDCSSLTSLDVTNFDTSSVTNMSVMFYRCSSLTSLDVTNFDTSSVTNMSIMFYLCSSLTSLDVTNFDTSIVTNMSLMFYLCSSLTDVVGVDDFNIEGLDSTSDLDNFMTNVTLPTARYDALLVNWDAQEPFDGMSPNFGNSTYTAGSAAATARANLISNDGWIITDGGTA